MQRIAVTGCASRFAKALLPLLEADPNIEQIIGIDLLPPTGTFSKLVFHKQDIRDPRIKETLAIAAAAGLQVIEIPGEMVEQALSAPNG
jgi:UDP-glucose 4-epimerase